MSDTFDLGRFEAAQAPVYAQVLDELRSGRKRSHWMWFVFPQAAGLGFSDMAQLYAIRSLAEACAYLSHPVLGVRLAECAGLVHAVQGRSARDILGSPDDMKFRSSMTLFKRAGTERVFEEALLKYFGGEEDGRTVEILARNF